jgi:hypothetical protein
MGHQRVRGEWAGAEELAPPWALMRFGLPTTPTREEWLCNDAHVRPGGRVGVDARLISVTAARALREALAAAGRTLVAEPDNLVDALWTDAPARPTHPVRVPSSRPSSPRPVRGAPVASVCYGGAEGALAGVLLAPALCEARDLPW